MDAQPVAVTTVEDSDATVPGLPAGKTVHFYMTAANDAGESQPSATVDVVAP